MSINSHVSPIIIVIIIVSLAMIVTALKGSGEKTKLELIAKPFLTAREQAMLTILEQLLPGYRIHAQVAMGALLKVKARSGQKVTPSDRNAFSQKIVDFVVQDRSTGHVIALIEVDDSMHRADADARRDAMTARAGYRTIRIAAGTRPSVLEVQRSLGLLVGTGALESATSC